MTGDTALRLAHFFGRTPEFWLNLPSLYELRMAQKKVGDQSKGCPGRIALNEFPRQRLPGTATLSRQSVNWSSPGTLNACAAYRNEKAGPGVEPGPADWQ